MGQYNFDQILDRTHTKSLKYDFAVKRGKPADVLPFWVADMDFEVPPELKQILLDRVNHGVFGCLLYTSSFQPRLTLVSVPVKAVRYYGRR